MGMTITEKILAKHAGKKKVTPGELIEAEVDVVLGNDITAPIAINEFKKLGSKKVFNKDKIMLVPDHFTPNKDIKSAQQVKIMRDFARNMKITNYFEIGQMGIEHALLPEKGLVLPGDLIIGADSHTCTYGALGAFSTGVGSTDMACAMVRGVTWFKVPSSIKFNLKGKFKKWVCGKDLILRIIGDIGVNGAYYSAMEYTGPGVKNIEMDDRFTISNMAIEAGAKNGIFPVDELTKKYIKKRAIRKYAIYKSDKNAVYEKTFEYDLSKIEPQVALPSLPENSRNISKVKNIKLDQVVIGSCTNGRIKDLETTAKILKGRKVAKTLRLLIIPATQAIFKETIKRGWMEIFVDAGAAVITPTCGPCLGGHMGVLAEGEKALATTNRNFVGRMGHPKSEVYLSGPAVAAASAILGRIGHPEEL